MYTRTGRVMSASTCSLGGLTMTDPVTHTPAGGFGRLQVRLDPWQPEFGPEFGGIEEQMPEAPDSLDLEIERPAHSWSAVEPGILPEPREPVWFIDGVRRIEARVTA